MKDDDIVENILASHKAIVAALPRGKDNIRSIMIKFTMTKPEKIKL